MCESTLQAVAVAHHVPELHAEQRPIGVVGMGECLRLQKQAQLADLRFELCQFLYNALLMRLHN